jgi:hypothetical protein
MGKAPAVARCLAASRARCHAAESALRDARSMPTFRSMPKSTLAAAMAVGILALLPVAAPAQNLYPPPGAQDSADAALAPAALDQLLAPIALYPDAVLAQILAASTYPLEVVQAHRWISQPQNASLINGALTAAVSSQGWDPSVQALIPFPDVLRLMDEHLEWTEQLGEAFLAQPGDVMEAVQRLRHRAEQAGSLKVSPEQSVVNEGGDIAIASPDEQSVYVPAYDPQCVYGAWPYPAQGPAGFAPWSGGCSASDDALSYDTADYLPFGFFLWAGFDWRRHCIVIDRQRFALAQPGRGVDSDVWRHDPSHRRGAGYERRANAERFAPAGPRGTDLRAIGGAGIAGRGPGQAAFHAPGRAEFAAPNMPHPSISLHEAPRPPALVGRPVMAAPSAPAAAASGHGLASPR